jgi:hypothetical protein
MTTARRTSAPPRRLRPQDDLADGLLGLDAPVRLPDLAERQVRDREGDRTLLNMSRLL